MNRSTHKNLTSWLAALAVPFAFGCVEADLNGDDDGQCEGAKCDSMYPSNDPSSWGAMEYNWEELNKPELAHGASEIVPWPDTYWPMTEDGYNQRWLGSSTLSPVEKYDKAFNNWVPESGFETYLTYKPFSYPGQSYSAEYYAELGPAASWAHEKGGNYRARVLTDPDGTPKWDEESTEDAVEWGGIEGWWGHCHAWSPAAFMAPEPQHPVTVNGVTFEVADVKALTEATFEGGRSFFLGGRCNTKDVERDEFGRIIEDECRDTNPGAFHVVTLNRMGINKLSFVIDATYDFQVWNQPVRDYTIDLQKEVSLEEALQLIGRTDVTEYPYNDKAKRFVHVKMRFRYVVEGSASREPYIPRIDSYTRTHNYEYLLELEDDGTIDGGEWIDDAPHPDFIWAPVGANDIRNGYWGDVIIAKDNVKQLQDLATGAEEPPVTGDEHAFESTPGTAIPDNDSAGISDTINVPESLNIGALRVTVDITHTYVGDLKVSLTRGEQTVDLQDQEGGGDDDLHKTFTVNDFNGTDARGDWTLEVSDNANVDTGTLDGWTLTVVTN